MIIGIAFVNTDHFNSAYTLTHMLSSSFKPPLVKLQLRDFGGEGKAIGEDSWIMALVFVTFYFHSFTTEKR